MTEIKSERPERRRFERQTGAQDETYKKRFDMEYMTQWRREVEHLEKLGIRPTFVRMNEEGVRSYKYTKTSDLFRVLADFYMHVEDERMWEKLSKCTDNKELQMTEEDMLRYRPDLKDRHGTDFANAVMRTAYFMEIEPEIEPEEDD